MTRERHLNIISFNIPDPPNYGGIIDVYYKIKAIANLGVKIHLYCYTYGREQSSSLEKICHKVNYYSRRTGISSNLSTLPYIMDSRKSNHLIESINKNGHPILIEGLHCSYPLIKGLFNNNSPVLRSHNIEHDYYFGLAKQEKNWLKKLYFYKEGYLLKQAINKLNPNLLIGAISPADTSFLEKTFKRSFWLPPFHSAQEFSQKLGIGSYAIYHGNLSVPENITAAEFIINAFKDLNYPLILAGKDPDQSILELAMDNDSIKIIANPSISKMNELVENAQMVLLPTFQATGIKLKLIDSLYRGRHCIANNDMIHNTQLDQLCHIANTSLEFIQKITNLQDVVFDESMINKRKTILNTYYSNETNAKLLISKLFN